MRLHSPCMRFRIRSNGPLTLLHAVVTPGTQLLNHFRFGELLLVRQRAAPHSAEEPQAAEEGCERSEDDDEGQEAVRSREGDRSDEGRWRGRQ